MKELSWTPVRKGESYCSPACGFQCTHKNYLAAIKKGTALAKKLGEGWTFEVWENMGWHYRAVMHNCKVYPNASHQYWVDLRAGDRQFCASGKNPKLAVKTALENAGVLAKNIKQDLKKYSQVYL
jgi:hypothetical protein